MTQGLYRSYKWRKRAAMWGISFYTVPFNQYSCKVRELKSACLKRTRRSGGRIHNMLSYFVYFVSRARSSQFRHGHLPAARFSYTASPRELN